MKTVIPRLYYNNEVNIKKGKMAVQLIVAGCLKILKANKPYF